MQKYVLENMAEKRFIEKVFFKEYSELSDMCLKIKVIFQVSTLMGEKVHLKTLALVDMAQWIERQLVN